MSNVAALLDRNYLIFNTILCLLSSQNTQLTVWIQTAIWWIFQHHDKTPVLYMGLIFRMFKLNLRGIAVYALYMCFLFEWL